MIMALDFQFIVIDSYINGHKMLLPEETRY